MGIQTWLFKIQAIFTQERCSKKGQMTTTAHLLSVCHRRLEQLLEVCIFRLMLVTCRTPLGDRLSVEDKDLEDKYSSL